MVKLRYQNHQNQRYGEKIFFTIELNGWEKIFTIGNFHRWKIHPNFSVGWFIGRSVVLTEFFFATSETTLIGRI